MIRNVKDVSGLLDRRFGGAAGRPLSLVRTLVWVLVGLYLIGLLLPAPKTHLSQTPYNRRLPNSNTRDLVLDKNDPRGWAHPKRDPSAFTIAWIGTSTMQNVAPGPWSFIPADVQARLPKIDGKPVRVEMYLFEAGRIMDLLSATEDAIARKPDLVMVDFNPVWVFNDRQIQEWDNLDPAAFEAMVTHLSTWPILASTYSPSDVALGVAATHLASIRDRWSYAEKLRKTIDDLSPLKLPAPGAAATSKKPTGLALVAQMQGPTNFWNKYQPLVPPSATSMALQEALLKGQQTDGSSMSEDVVGALLQSLADSKIPSVAYVSAIAPAALADPGVDAALRRVEKHLGAVAAEHRARTLLVEPQSAIRTVGGLTFKDLVHMTHSTPMVDHLTDLICTHLAAVDPTTRCTPVPREAKR